MCSYLNSAKKALCCVLAVAVSSPSMLCAMPVQRTTSLNEIKGLISFKDNAPYVKKDGGNAVLLSVAAGTSVVAVGMSARAYWQRYKINRVSELVISDLKGQIEQLNIMVKNAQAAEKRAVDALASQAALQEKTVMLDNSIFDKDISRAELRGFNRGYDAAFVGSEELREAYENIGFSKGYARKGTEEFLKGQEVGAAAVRNPLKKLTQADKADEIISGLIREMDDLRATVLRLESRVGLHKEISTLVVDINKYMVQLENSKYAPETAKLEKAIAESLQKLEALKTGGITKSMLREYSTGVLRQIKNRGGAIGIVVVGLVSVGLLLKSAPVNAQISNTRLNAQRLLKETFNSAPQAFAAQVFALNQAYGTDMTASILFEHQEYLPLLENQIKVMRLSATQDLLSSLNGDMYSSPSDNKTMLLKSLGAR